VQKADYWVSVLVILSVLLHKQQFDKKNKKYKNNDWIWGVIYRWCLTDVFPRGLPVNSRRALLFLVLWAWLWLLLLLHLLLILLLLLAVKLVTDVVLVPLVPVFTLPSFAFLCPLGNYRCHFPNTFQLILVRISWSKPCSMTTNHTLRKIWFSIGLWQWLIDYTSKLDTVHDHWGISDTHTIVGVGSIPIFRSEVLIILTHLLPVFYTSRNITFNWTLDILDTKFVALVAVSNKSIAVCLLCQHPDWETHLLIMLISVTCNVSIIIYVMLLVPRQ
jgi:hypothetical protein